MTDADESVRCTARLGDSIQCSLAYDHPHGHVYVSGSFVKDHNGDRED